MNEHDYLILVLTRWLERNDYRVAARLEDRTKPALVGGHKPDVFATQANTRLIGEAEVCDRLGDQDTQERWVTFSDAANEASSDACDELHIIVPSRCLDAAKQQATAWGVTATFHTEKLADQPGLTGER